MNLNYSPWKIRFSSSSYLFFCLSLLPHLSFSLSVSLLIVPFMILLYIYMYISLPVNFAIAYMCQIWRVEKAEALLTVIIQKQHQSTQMVKMNTDFT